MRSRAGSAFAATGLAAGLVGAVAARRRAGELVAEVEAERPLGPTGVIVGAEPLEVHQSATHAALLLHGFSDTPQSMRHVAEGLVAAGWSVELPLLPGHGRTLDDFGAARADDWIRFAIDRVAALRRRYAVVSVVGQSMGAALATIAAAEHDDLAALVLLAPYLAVPARLRRLAPLLRLGAFAAPWLATAGDGESILDPGAREASRGFGVASGRLLAELDATTRAAWSALPEVGTPTLVIASHQDVRVPVEETQRAYTRLGAPVRRLEWLEHSGHVIAADRERDAVRDRTIAWLEGCGGAPSPAVRRGPRVASAGPHTAASGAPEPPTPPVAEP